MAVGTADGGRRASGAALPAAITLLTLACVVLAVVGVSVLPLVATAVLGWFVAFSLRWGSALGIASSVLGSGLVVLAELVLFALVGAPILVGSVVLWGALGLGSALAVAARHSPINRSGMRRAALAWLPPLLGPAIWATAMLATVVLPSASRFSWVMAGDSANNILFARETTYNDGIQLGADSNPVPLPAALIAIAMSAGRAATPAPDLLRHDIAAFALVWGIMIALTCYLAGAAAAAAVDPARRWIVVVAGAGASLIPLSWFVTGYPIEYGFFNAHVALPIVFASWIAAVGATRNPAIALSSLLAACTLMLAVWGPLVLVPLLLAVVVVVRYRRDLLLLRGRALVVPALALAQLGAFGLVATLPSLLAQGGFLAGVGGIIPFPRILVFAAIVGSGLIAGLAIWRKRALAGPALAAVVLAAVLGIGVLLFISRAQPSPWTYYPTKLAWLMTIVLGVLALGTLVGVVAQVRKAVFAVVAVGLVVVTLGALYYAARSVPGYPWSDPIPRVLTDDFGAGDNAAERIFAYSDPVHPHLLWHSGDPLEGTINFWLLQMRADSTKEHEDLRVYAYGHGDTIDDLCAIVRAMGGDVVVDTADSALPAAVADTCGELATVKRDTTR
ncbi:hypothetical protein BH11ACT4_BH11ACT4_02120 [soil metagenome]